MHFLCPGLDGQSGLFLSTYLLVCSEGSIPEKPLLRRALIRKLRDLSPGVCPVFSRLFRKSGAGYSE